MGGFKIMAQFMVFMIIISCVLFLLCSTYDKYFSHKNDKNLERQIFNECLSKIPTGPNTTTFNDWSEVIEQCRHEARDLSY